MKKFLSVLLVLSLCLGLMATAYAANQNVDFHRH